MEHFIHTRNALTKPFQAQSKGLILEEGIVNAIVKGLTEGGPDFVLSLGWLLYLLERYYFAPRREKEFRSDVAKFMEDYKSLAEKTANTLSSFSTILEILKDRIGRAV